MSQHRRVFVRWLIALAVVWVIANLPHDGGSLKSFLHWAGFPWTFAMWEFGSLTWFSPLAFVADVALGLVVIVTVAALCSWSRREATANCERSTR